MTTTEITKVEGTAAVVGNPFSKSIVNDWIQYCDVQPCTQKTYDKAIQSFFGYLASVGIEQPKRDDVIGYREHLRSNGYAVSSVRLYLSVVKKFFKWLASRGLYLNIADGVKLPAMPTDEHARDALTIEEARQTLSFFKGKSEKELRDRAILALMLNCGLRSVEVVRLDVGDLEKRKGLWFIRVHGKARGGKVDSVQVSEPVKARIDEYLSVRPRGKKGTPMFISTARRNRGERLQTQTVSRLAKATFKQIGIDSERVTCHSCRATAVTLMLQAGVPMREVQRVVRHRNSATTEIYARDLDKFNNRGVDTLSKLLFAA